MPPSIHEMPLADAVGFEQGSEGRIQDNRQPGREQTTEASPRFAVRFITILLRALSAWPA